jgi:hypothetical protein
MSSQTALVPPIHPTMENQNLDISAMILVDPSWFYLQAFAHSCLQLPASGDEFRAKYGDFPYDVDSLCAALQGLRDVGTAFGDCIQRYEQGNNFVAASTPPADLLGQCVYAMGAFDQPSVFWAATAYWNLVNIVGNNLHSPDDPNYNAYNKQQVLGALNDPSAYGYPGWVDVSQQTENAWQTLTNNALAFRDQLGTVNGQLQGAFDQINEMLGVASFTVSVDAQAIIALRNQANDLMDKYNREMAFVNWESDPKSLLPEVGLLGPFGGGMTFGILAIVGNILAKDAENLKTQWNAVQSSIASLAQEEAKKANFINDFSNLAGAVSRAWDESSALLLAIENIRGAFNVLGLKPGAISSYDDFQTYDVISDLLDLPTANAEWQQIQQIAGNFFPLSVLCRV